MKRRNFLAFMGGAAVSAPALAKEAAAKVTEDLALGRAGFLSGGIGGLAPEAGNFPAQMNPIANAQRVLGIINGLTDEKRRQLKRQLYVSNLDADLASYRSMSIGARIEMQRERQLERHIQERKGIFSILADGGDPYADQF
jgi:hypothetical protein